MSKKSPVKNTAKPGFAVPRTCLVTGGSGFVGQRLVEMLVERGCKRVISFDIAPTPKDGWQRAEIEYAQGDLTDADYIMQLFSRKWVLDKKEGEIVIECVFHIAALVGPYHHKDVYRKVNFDGSANVLNACKAHNIKRIVMSSSPSTRFPYPDPNVRNKTEAELQVINKGDFAPVFLQPYAETKALGEKLVRDACGSKNDDLLTIAVAPHQVYGPRDGLFLPNLLDAAGSGKLRIFGDGLNRISFCHVDNYCHGLILGHEALFEGSPALGKFYIITDGPGVRFWEVLDQCIQGMGFDSLWTKMKLPGWLMMGLAYLALWFGKLWHLCTGTPEHIINFKLKLIPFSVKMLLIDREFNIAAARKDLKYEPIYSFERGWAETIEWFKVNWLPKYLAGNK
jgi:nucleoside-diphosphate-sugar epimerase